MGVHESVVACRGQDIVEGCFWRGKGFGLERLYISGRGGEEKLVRGRGWGGE